MKNHIVEDYEKFCTRADADKAINSLRGILLGIKMDNTIHQKEKNELKLWVQKHYHLINKNPFRDFMLIISESIHENKLDLDSIEDMYWLCQKYEDENPYYNAITYDLQVLQGICHGIISDGIIKQNEIEELDKWLELSSHLKSHYPYDELYSLITSVLADGIVDENEQIRLKKYFFEFVNLADNNTSKKILKETQNISIDGICTSNPEITFNEKVFCLSGNFKIGKKDDIYSSIYKCGGKRGNVTQKTDYLIVGDDGNKHWAFSCYGRKVEQALKLRKQGFTISIIHEFDFNDFLEDSLHK